MRIQLRLIGQFSALAIAALMAGSAAAAPIEVDVTAFSPTATLIDFSGLSSGTPITSQFAAQGATFSGGLFSFPGAQASNFDIGLSLPGTSITIDFSSTMLRAGFTVSQQAFDDLNITVSAYKGGVLVSTGSLNFVTPGNTTRFVGVEDADLGIDRLVLTAFAVVPGGTGRFIMDNLRFDQAEVIPEPSAALLFPIGILLAAHGIRRRRQLA
jgi:hypothetical protein